MEALTKDPRRRTSWMQRCGEALRACTLRRAPVAGWDARYRLAFLGSLTSIASRGMAMLLMFLSVRLTIDYLGTGRFGMWATLASMAAMLSLLDLGVGNALVNRVAYAAASGETSALRRLVSGGAALLVLIGVLSATGLSILAFSMPWKTLFKLADDVVAAEARQAGILFAVLFGINLVASGMLRILAGQQRSHEANLLSAGATALACLALFLVARMEAGIPWLLTATFGVQTLGGLVAGLLLIHRRQLVVKEMPAALALERVHLLGVGALFMLLQVGTMLGWLSDSVILALLCGSAEVAVLAVAQRLFQFASQPFAMLNAPLWASYADAHARRDTRFIRTTLKHSFTLSLCGSAIVSLALFAYGQPLIALWTQGTVVVPTSVLALLAGWTVLEVTGNAFGVYLNGCGIVRQQVVVVLVFCALVLPLKLWLGSTWGIEGLLGAAIGAYLVVIVGLYGHVFRSSVLEPLRDSP